MIVCPSFIVIDGKIDSRLLRLTDDFLSTLEGSNCIFSPAVLAKPFRGIIPKLEHSPNGDVRFNKSRRLTPREHFFPSAVVVVPTNGLDPLPLEAIYIRK